MLSSDRQPGGQTAPQAAEGVGRQEGGLTTGLRSESAVLISIQDKSFTQPDSLAAVPTTKLISFPALIYKVSPPLPLPCLSLAPKPQGEGDAWGRPAMPPPPPR